MERTDSRYQAYMNILKEELIPAMGCTEPIALAYGADFGFTTFRKVSGGDFYPGMLIREIK